MSKKTKKDTQEVDIVEGIDVAESALDDADVDIVEGIDEPEQIVNEQANLALANMVSRGVKMADAKKRLGIK